MTGLTCCIVGFAVFPSGVPKSVLKLVKLAECDLYILGCTCKCAESVILIEKHVKRSGTTHTNWCYAANIGVIMEYMYLIFIKAVLEEVPVEAGDGVPFSVVFWSYWQFVLYWGVFISVISTTVLISSISGTFNAVAF